MSLLSILEAPATVAELIQSYHKARDPLATLRLMHKCVIHREAEMFRYSFTRNVCWWVPTFQLAQYVAMEPTLEIMGGSGFFSGIVRHHDGDIICTDCPDAHHEWQFHGKEWTLVQLHDAMEAIALYGHDRRLFMAWPPRDSLAAYHAIEYYHQLRPRGEFIFVGYDDPTTGGVEFHRYLRRNYEQIGIFGSDHERITIPSWPDINDHLTVWRPKRKTRQ